MKKLFYILILFVSFSSVSLAQDKAIATTKGKTELVKSKQEGVFEIKFPDNITKEDVDKNTKYYVYYFKVDFDESSKNAVITMVENDSRNRSIIMRFLSALKIDGVMVDGQELTLEEFKNDFLL